MIDIFLLICWRALYILYINPLSDICIVNIIYQSLACLSLNESLAGFNVAVVVVIVVVVFDEKKFLILTKSKFQSFLLWLVFFACVLYKAKL